MAQHFWNSAYAGWKYKHLIYPYMEQGTPEIDRCGFLTTHFSYKTMPLPREERQRLLSQWKLEYPNDTKSDVLARLTALIIEISSEWDTDSLYSAHASATVRTLIQEVMSGP